MRKQENDYYRNKWMINQSLVFFLLFFASDDDVLAGQKNIFFGLLKSSFLLFAFHQFSLDFLLRFFNNIPEL